MHDPPLSPASAAHRVMARLDALATCTAHPGEITRLFLTEPHRAAIGMVAGWMQDAGLTTRLDASGTLVGTRPGQADAPLLLLGSHIDTVRNAGRYDGCLGVAVGIEAAAALRDAALPYRLEVRAFGDEEGVRFPVTLTGAHATAGTFDSAWLAARDTDGITLEAAMRAFGLDPDLLPGCVASGAFAYLEVHIEQGPVLEAAGAPLGIVTAINGAARFALTVTGEAGHAGTVPMAQRRDALVAASAMVLAVQHTALAHEGTVATVGNMVVSPGAANVIPGSCRLSIDLRAPADARRDRAEAALRVALDEIAGFHDVSVAVRSTYRAGAVACDARLQTMFENALARQDDPAVFLPSGAGHDAMAIATLCPIGMLFVRCAGGLSHHPDELVTATDVASAIRALTQTLSTLGADRFR